MNDPNSPTVLPDYLEIHALDCAPFENRIDPKFFYAGTTLMQRLDLLAHLTQFGDPPVLVTGPAGSGKTTLLDKFQAQANSRWQLARLRGDSVEQLPECIASALGDADASAGTEALLSRWDTETDASQLFVIAIDEAERLSAEACTMLCGLLDSPLGERLRILLFGTPAVQVLLKQSLDSLSSTRTPQVLEVPRLSEEETSAYLMYRLAVAGFSGESPFSAIEVRGICKAADGWPGGINQLADQTLREHAARRRDKNALQLRRPSSFARLRWLPVLIIGAFLFAYLLWQPVTTDQQEVTLPEEAPRADQTTPLALPAPVPDAAEPIRKPPPAPALFEPAEAIAAPGGDAENVAAPEPKTDPVASAIPAPVTTELPSRSGPTAAPESLPPVVATPALSPPAPEPAAIAPATTASRPPVELPHRDAWLLEQAGHLYSLQLLGSRSEQSVRGFISGNKLDLAKTAYYRGDYKGGEWFVLMYGLYPSREAALRDIANLPDKVRKSRPWPRTLLAVQQSIRDTEP